MQQYLMQHLLFNIIFSILKLFIIIIVDSLA
jgi:hypothetical protein